MPCNINKFQHVLTRFILIITISVMFLYFILLFVFPMGCFGSIRNNNERTKVQISHALEMFW